MGGNQSLPVTFLDHCVSRQLLGSGIGVYDCTGKTKCTAAMPQSKFGNKQSVRMVLNHSVQGKGQTIRQTVEAVPTNTALSSG